MEAIVVGGIDIGEADRVVYLLSAEDGRSRAVARAARKSKKRFAGKLDPGCRLELHIRKGRGSLPSINSAELITSPRFAREDLDRIALLTYGCEICAALAPEHHAAPKLFGLLCVWLLILEGEEVVGTTARIALEAKALTFAGLTPSFLRCASCGQDLDDPAVFDPENGGGVHARCGGGRRIAAQTLAMFDQWRRTPLRELVDSPAAVGTEELWLVSDFIRHHLGRAIRTRGLLEDLAQMHVRR